VFLLGLAWFVTHGGFHSGREPTPYTGRRAEAALAGTSSADDDVETADGAEPDDADEGVEVHGRPDD
jgi:hypothetical protein